MEFEQLRAQFPVTEKCVYLNHASMAPVSQSVCEAGAIFFQQLSECGGIPYDRWVDDVAQVRRRLAALMGVLTSEIAFVPNTSTALGLVAEGLAWRQGDQVLVLGPDFPSSVLPWQHLRRRGVTVRFVGRNRRGVLERRTVEEALEPRTRVLAVTSVDYQTGAALDLEELGALCREKGILFCVDGVQSLGVMPLHLKRDGIHFFASAAHKWLLGPPGIGVLYLAQEVHSLVHPPMVGWKSVLDEEAFGPQVHLKTDAAAFEPGTYNFPGIFGLGAALAVHESLGTEAIYARVSSLNDLAAEELLRRGISLLSPLGEKERSGILSFVPPGEPEACRRFLAQKGIHVARRGAGIRLSPHFYNVPEEISLFLKALDAFASF